MTKLSPPGAGKRVQKKHYLPEEFIWYNDFFKDRQIQETVKADKQVAQKRKKSSKKKASTTRSRKVPLSCEDIEQFKQRLFQKRVEIIGDVKEMHDEALKKSRLDASGDLSSMPIHMADIGTDNYEQEFALGLMDGERKLLKEIDDSLVRIEAGTYGICEGTGELIATARLEAQPWARYCVEYALKIEKGQVTETD